MKGILRLLLLSIVVCSVTPTIVRLAEAAEADPRKIAWDAQDALDRYLYLWRNENFADMYSLAAASLREKASREGFISGLEEAKRNGYKLVEYEVGEVGRSKKTKVASRLSIPVKMVFRFSQSGPSGDEMVKVSKNIAVVKEGGEWRVSGSISQAKKTKGQNKRKQQSDSRKYIEKLIP